MSVNGVEPNSSCRETGLKSNSIRHPQNTDYSVSVHLSNIGGHKDMSLDLPVSSIGSPRRSKISTDFTGFKNNQWQPYKNAKHELPCTFFVPNFYYKVRWILLTFFHYRIFSVWEHCITLGEALVVLGSVGLVTYAGFYSCCDSILTGNVASYPLLATFVLSSKNSVLTFLLGVPYERLLFYHKLSALFSLALGGMHGVVSFINAEGWWKYAKDEIISGFVLYGSALATTLVSFYYVRKYFYELFYRFHVAFGVLMLVYTYKHGATIAFYGVYFWAFDWVLKLTTILVNLAWTRKCTMSRLPGKVVRVEFEKKGFKYRTGQHIMLCVPRISPFEWHPLSISSAPHEDTVTVHLKVLGDWTKKFHDYLPQGTDKEMLAFVDGPFGNPAINLDSGKFKHFLLISGGIGITPMQSIANELTWQMEMGRDIHKIMFVWSFGDAELLSSALNSEKEFMKHENNYSGRFETHFHMSKRAKTTIQDDAIQQADPELVKRVEFGRAHLSVYFEKMFEAASDEKDSQVAVLCCGPQPMMEETLRLCQAWSKNKVYFKYHGETFDF